MSGLLRLKAGKTSANAANQKRTVQQPIFANHVSHSPMCRWELFDMSTRRSSTVGWLTITLIPSSRFLTRAKKWRNRSFRVMLHLALQLASCSSSERSYTGDSPQAESLTKRIPVRTEGFCIVV